VNRNVPASLATMPRFSISTPPLDVKVASLASAVFVKRAPASLRKMVALPL